MASLIRISSQLRQAGCTTTPTQVPLEVSSSLLHPVALLIMIMFTNNIASQRTKGISSSWTTNLLSNYLNSANCRFKPPPASAGNCLVIEDSMAGVEAGLLAGMQVSFS